jgi:mRNA interferase MazF
MPPTISYKRGDVVLAPFPFSDQTSLKQRPALVISVEGFQEQGPDLLIMAMTSQVSGPLKLGEFLIRDWQVAGLLKSSA